jgi:AcrR family transcriptional regulator
VKALVSERGYDDVSVTEIARTAGITPATFYNHFSGKDAVLGDILVSARVDWLTKVDQQLGSEGSIFDRLKALEVSIARGFLSNTKLYRAYLLHADFSPGLIESNRRTMRNVDHSIYLLIRQGQEAGEISTVYSAQMLELVYRAAHQAICQKWATGDIWDEGLIPAQLQALQLVLKGSSDT